MAVSDRKSAQVYRWLLAYIDENKFSGNQKLPKYYRFLMPLGLGSSCASCQSSAD